MNQQHEINIDLMYMRMGLFDYDQYLIVEDYILNVRSFILSLLRVELSDLFVRWIGILGDVSEFGLGMLKICVVGLSVLLVVTRFQGQQ
jgi:hypothetical protein